MRVESCRTIDGTQIAHRFTAASQGSSARMGLYTTLQKTYKRKQAEKYNQAHTVRQRPDLEIGQLYTRNISTRGEVKGLAETPRSYILDTPAGELRRNKCHLTPIPEKMCDKQNVEQPMPQQTKTKE